MRSSMSFSISVGSALLGGAATVIPGTGPLVVPTGTVGTTMSGAFALGAIGRGAGSVAGLVTTIGGPTVTVGLNGAAEDGALAGGSMIGGPTSTMGCPTVWAWMVPADQPISPRAAIAAAQCLRRISPPTCGCEIAVR